MRLRTFRKAWVLLLLMLSILKAEFKEDSFNFGKSFSGDGIYEGVDYITIWAGSDSPEYGVNFNPWWHGAMLDKAVQNGATPVYYAYLIAFKARWDLGLQDCDVSPSNSLCTKGAQYIRDNYSGIIQHYRDYAQATAARLGNSNSDMIWMIEPDFMQYSATGDALSPYSQQGGGIPDSEMAVLMGDIIAAIKSAMPNARIAMDISPWNNNIEGWLTHFRALDIDYMFTSGGRTEAESERIRFDNNNLVTWNQVSSYMGKKIIADCGYGVGGGGTGHDSDWDNLANLNARIADGVLGVTQNEPRSDWASVLQSIRPQLDPISGISSSSVQSSSSELSSSSIVSSSSEEQSSSSEPSSSDESSSSDEPSSSDMISSSDIQSSSSVFQGDLLSYFGVPGSASLPSLNGSYSYNGVWGSGGPDLSGVTGFSINWDAGNNALYQFSLNTNTGVPNWYVDLRQMSESHFNESSPWVNFQNTGIVNMDGDYWVAVTENAFVLVEQSGSYALIFSSDPVEELSSSSEVSSSDIVSSSDVISSSDMVSSSEVVSSSEEISSSDIVSSSEETSSSEVVSSSDIVSSQEISSSDDASSSEVQSSSSVESNILSRYGVPASEALPSVNASFTYFGVDGENGPSLGNVSSFAINWDQPNNTLHQLSANTSDGQPGWWLDLRSRASYGFNQSGPEISFSGTGLTGLDGDYFVNLIDGNLVLVEQSGSFAIIMSQNPVELSSSSQSSSSQISSSSSIISSSSEELSSETQSSSQEISSSSAISSSEEISSSDEISSFDEISSSEEVSSSHEQSSSGESGLLAQFSVPRGEALPSVNAAYSFIESYGEGAPDLSGVTRFTLNWDRANNGLYQMSINTSNGMPSWYVDLRSCAAWDFNSSSPEITFENSGVPGLDGSYYVNLIEGDFVMVRKDGFFALQFKGAKVFEENILISSILLTEQTEVQWKNVKHSAAAVVRNSLGTVVWSQRGLSEYGSFQWGATGIKTPGWYFLSIESQGQVLSSASGVVR